jgi:demethylmenaquinone methyltransferase / 2-methoxy-6-polyprenyl-1,4-benzoquinol methylase
MKATALKIFEGLASSYETALDIATMYQDRKWKRWVAEQSRFEGTVLDVGCGTLVLEEREVPGGCDVVGVDLTKDMLMLGKAKGVRGVRGLFNADAEQLPFADETFDVVVSCYVPKYVSVETLLGELARVAKSGGRVVMYDFSRPRGWYRVPLAFYMDFVMVMVGRLLRLRGGRASATFLELPGIVERSTWDRGLAEKAESAGLRDVAVVKMTGGVVTGMKAVKAPSGSNVGSHLRDS